MSWVPSRKWIAAQDVALGAFVWTDPAGPAEAVRGAAALLSEEAAA